MLFKNLTGKKVKIRRARGRFFDWSTIQLKGTVELERLYGFNLGLTPVNDEVLEEIVEPEIEVVESEEFDLESMSKDELNDFASGKGFSKEINMYMKKSLMIKKIKALLKKKVK